MDALLQDVRFAGRMLRKAPGFTALAVVTLALGLGANTAIFSVVNSLLLRPYAFANLDQLVLIHEASKPTEPEKSRVTPADLFDLTADRSIFQDAAWFDYHSFNLGRPGDVESATGYAVSPNLFSMIGAEAALGRVFQTEEGIAGRDRVAILNYGFWKRRFGGDAGILGHSIQIDGRDYTVIGIMPRQFNYPLAAEVWTPLVLTPERRTDRKTVSLSALARLRPGVSLRAAESRLNDLGQQLQGQYPATNTGRNFTLVRLREEQYRYTLSLFLMLQGAAAFVLLLAGVNVANLVMIRVIGRQRELAIRAALGASRARVFRFFLSESLLLSVIAGLAAAGAALWTVDAIRVSLPVGYRAWLAGWDTMTVDGRVLGITVGCIVLLAAIFAAAMALRANHIDVNRGLKEGGGTATSLSQNRLRSSLVVVQIVLALVLLVGAGVMARGFLHLQDVFETMDPAHALRYEVTLPKSRYTYDTATRSYYDRLLERLSALPGVTSAALIANPPASNVESVTTFFTLPDRPALRDAEAPSADLQIVSPHTFELLRVSLLEGRPLSPQDGPLAPAAAVISRHMAQSLWGNSSAIGHKLRLGTLAAAGPEITIVGVVADVQINWFDPLPRNVIYRTYSQTPKLNSAVLVRSAADPSTLLPAVRRAMWDLDPTVAVAGLRPMPVEIAESLGPLRVIGVMMLIFGGIALLLSAVGLYGVVAHSVAGRRHEFSIRLAIGAQHSDLLRLVVREAVLLTTVGVFAGALLSIAAVRALASRVYGIIALSPAILIAFALLLFTISLAASYLPARRASHADPLDALRRE